MYNVELEIASGIFLIILFVYLKLQYNVGSKINTQFRQLVVVVFITNSLDVVTAIFINHGTLIAPKAHLVLNSLYMFMACTMGLFFCKYFSLIAYKRLRATWIDRNSKWLMLLFLAVLVCNAYTNFMFGFNEACEYTHGSLYFMMFLGPQLFIFYGITIILRRFFTMTLNQRLSIILYSLLGFSGSLIQMFLLPNYLLALFGTSLSVLMIMFSMETPDYVHLVKTMRNLEHTSRSLEKANKAKSEFLSNMSHELRTPINFIIGYNELILKNSVEKEIVENSLNVQAGARALLSQVNNIFDYTDMEMGHLKILPVKYSVSSLLQDLVLFAKFNAERKSLANIITVDEKIPHRLFGDVVRIMQVMLAILSNAYKYTKTGSVALEVRWIPVDNQKGKLSFSVKDTGIGISKDTLKHLGTDNQMNGLGLPLVSKILSLMKTRLVIESEESKESKGTKVSFEVEQTVVDFNPIGKIKFEGQNAVMELLDENLFTASCARILVVDDNEMNIKLFCGLLKDTKITFDAALNGTDALKMLEDNLYDMVFLDHMMPGKDGLQVLREMREKKLNEGVPVVVFTANVIESAKDKYMAAGFDGYLAKPVNIKEVYNCIRELLRSDLIIEHTPISNVSARISENFMNKLPEQLDGKLGMSFCGANKESYMGALESFIDEWYPDLIDEAFGTGDLHLYAEYMSKLENKSLLIGAVKISSIAKSLYDAAVSENITFVREHHAEILMSCRMLLHELLSLFGKSGNPYRRKEKPALLMVDDELVELKIAKRMFGEQFTFYEAHNAAETFVFLDTSTPDIILLDVNIPGTNGFEIFSKIQENERLKNIPVVFLSADENVQTEIKCFEAGAMDFIKKPFVKEVVIRRTSRILQLSRLQKSLRHVARRTHSNYFGLESNSISEDAMSAFVNVSDKH